MKEPKLTRKEMQAFVDKFFENWAHLKDMADSLQCIAAVLEEMQRDAKKFSWPFEVKP